MEREVLIKHIQDLMDDAGITAYEIGKRAGVPNTKVYSILSQDKKECPEIESLEIICEGLGITLSKLFEFASSENDAVYLTEGERDWLEIYRSVPLERIPALMAYTKEFLKLYNDLVKNKK